VQEGQEKKDYNLPGRGMIGPLRGMKFEEEYNEVLY
jgi:hypothetical protein